MNKGAEGNWKRYAENTKSGKPRQLLVDTLPFVEKRGDALDLGAGALNESHYLLEEGFSHVTALDKSPVGMERASSFPKERFSYVIDSIETFRFPEAAFDLVNAQRVLPFIDPESFLYAWKSICDTLRPGGIITGQFFGDRDAWNGTAGMTFHSIEEANDLLRGLEIISFKEEEDDKRTASGDMKHWHLLHFIARKPHAMNEALSDAP